MTPYAALTCRLGRLWPGRLTWLVAFLVSGCASPCRWQPRVEGTPGQRAPLVKICDGGARIDLRFDQSVLTLPPPQDGYTVLIAFQTWVDIAPDKSGRRVPRWAKVLHGCKDAGPERENRRISATFEFDNCVRSGSLSLLIAVDQTVSVSEVPVGCGLVLNSRAPLVPAHGARDIDGVTTIPVSVTLAVVPVKGEPPPLGKVILRRVSLTAELQR